MAESTTDKILVGILVGIIIWLITSAVNFLILRYRLEKALIEDINHRRSNLKDTKEFMEMFYKNFIKEGKRLSYYARFTKQEFPFYEDVRKDLFKYFGAKNLISIMRCYEALEEVEILTEGILYDFGDYTKKDKDLSADDITYLERKKERLLSVIGIFEQREIRNLSDLPRDYKGMLAAVDVIRK
jgi:hypothetical protein